MIVIHVRRYLTAGLCVECDHEAFAGPLETGRRLIRWLAHEGFEVGELDSVALKTDRRLIR